MIIRIQTLHPDPHKSGVNISQQKYDQIKDAIIEAIRSSDVLTFKELNAKVGQKLGGQFKGSISWYVTTVKLDLEAREVIERVPKVRPQHLRVRE